MFHNFRVSKLRQQISGPQISFRKIQAASFVPRSISNDIIFKGTLDTVSIKSETNAEIVSTSDVSSVESTKFWLIVLLMSGDLIFCVCIIVLGGGGGGGGSKVVRDVAEENVRAAC